MPHCHRGSAPTNREVEKERADLRKAQAKAVMPMIGPMLDAWEGVPNDVRGYMKEQCPELGCWLDDISAAMEFAGISET